MEKFTTLTGIAAPLKMINVDTDMVIPKQFLTTIERSGLGRGLFFEMRFDSDGNENPDFILNKTPYREAKILIAGENFGCGSSREHAAWAMLDMGLTAVIAPSFSDIFSGNAFKNGILAVELPQEQVDRLLEVAQTHPITIDLENQIVTTPFQDRFAFDVDPFRNRCLREGLDEIGLTLASADAITHHEAGRAQDLPWLDRPLAVSR